MRPPVVLACLAAGLVLSGTAAAGSKPMPAPPGPVTEALLAFAASAASEGTGLAGDAAALASGGLSSASGVASLAASHAGSVLAVGAHVGTPPPSRILLPLPGGGVLGVGDVDGDGQPGVLLAVRGPTGTLTIDWD